MIEITLTPEERERCLKHAWARAQATKEQFSYATQKPVDKRSSANPNYYIARQYEVEVIGALAECAFAIYLNPGEPDHSVWDYVGREPGSTDFEMDGKSVEVKATYTPPSRDPHLAILPYGKRSDLYVLAYADMSLAVVLFLGWAKDTDFPPRHEAFVRPGWRSATLNIPSSELRQFKDIEEDV